MGEYDIGKAHYVTYSEAKAVMPIVAQLNGRRRHPDPTVAAQITTILEYGDLPPSYIRDIKQAAGNVLMRLQTVREDVDYSSPFGGKQVIFDSQKASDLFESWLEWADRQGYVEE